MKGWNSTTEMGWVRGKGGGRGGRKNRYGRNTRRKKNENGRANLRCRI